MSLELLEAVAELETSQKMKSATMRRQLAVDVFRGTVTDPAEIVERMAEVELTSAELASQIEAYRQRIDLAAQVAAASGAEALVAANRAKLAEIDRAWQVTWTEHQDTVGGLQTEINTQAALISTADQARRRLVDSVGPEVRERLEHIRRALRSAEVQLDTISRDTERHEEAYRSNRELADQGKLEPADTASLPAAWERLLEKRKAVAAKQAELAELVRQQTDLMNGEALAAEAF